MKKLLPLYIFLLIGFYFASCATSQQDTPPSFATAIEIGKPAPDFELMATDGKMKKLSSFKGKKNVLLAFYPKAGTMGWTLEFQSFGKDYKKFQVAQAEIAGISTDDVQAQKDFCNKTGYPGIMLSDKDFHVSKLYGAFNEGGKYSRRVYFIIDKKGAVRFMKESMLPLRNKELLSELSKIK